MQSTSNVGNAEHAGSQPTPLERLRPWQIATLALPGQDVTVIDASDKEFQAFVRRCNLHIADDENEIWSFDDRVRLINHGRKRGIDLFAEYAEKSSDQEQKQFGNNSEKELIGELFEGHEAACQELSATIGNPTPTELRDDIDLLLQEMEKSSSGEQKEFGEEADES